MKQCDWCKCIQMSGQYRSGQWVCYTCFPANSGRMEEALRCWYCNTKTKQGQVLLGRFTCWQCCGMIDPPSKKKNKYPKQPYYDNPHYVKKSRKREKKSKLKKITIWKVLIEDISDGKL